MKYFVTVKNKVTGEEHIGTQYGRNANHAALLFVYIEPGIISDEKAFELDSLDEINYDMSDLLALVPDLSITVKEVK